jgi:exopolysaccharide biosynthesis polyprenyl glycosylphosphotransferase
MKRTMKNNKVSMVFRSSLLALILVSILPVGWLAAQIIWPHVQGMEIMHSNFFTQKNIGKSYAPEPSSFALLLTGLLGMMMTAFRRTYAFTKRLIDIIGATLGLILLSPLLLITALLVKLTSQGPVIYSQVRVGIKGRRFKIYKFRTMKTDAEKTTGPVWASSNDSRLTPIGRFLRKSRIDELPQFINVLMGQMSLIGPRPERPVFVDKLKMQISGYEKRLEVKPGITGLAQVFHHYDENISDVRKKVKYDQLYIKKLCLRTDLGILFRTFGVVLSGEGAK